MKNLYKLKIPQISQDLIHNFSLFTSSLPDTGYDIINDPNINKEKDIWVNFHNQTKTTRSSYVSHLIPEDLQLQIEKEIPEHVFPSSKVDFYIQYISGGEKLIPHRDPDRKLSILCNISNDGAITNFYKRTNSFDPDQFMYSLDEVKIYESYKILPYTWYVFNNETIHSVDQMSQPRIAITSNLNIHPELELPDYETFCRKYHHLLMDW